MPLNKDPIFTREPDIQIGGAVNGPSANTAQDGTGANMYSIFQADTTNGGFVEKLILRAVGSPAATVCRVYIHAANGSFTAGTTNTASNTSLVAEIAMSAVTLSQVAASIPVEVPLGFALPAGFRILISFGTSTGASGTGYAATVIGGKY
jgi:hypothetical protein